MSNALNLGSIVLPGDGYPSIFAFQLPVLTGLEGAYFFGDGLSLINKNYAPGKANATIKGAPVLGANGGVEFSLNNYLDTGIADVPNLTVLSVFRETLGTGSANACGIIGNNLSLATGGIGVYRNAIGTTVSCTTIKGGALENAVATIVPGGYTAIALRAKDSAVSVSNNLTLGTTFTGALSGARTLTPQPMLIGRLPNASFSTVHEQLMALVFSRAISDAELDLLSAWMKKYCASKGYTV